MRFISAPCAGPCVAESGTKRQADPRVAGVIALFERLGPGDLPQLGRIYHEQARFKDPFNEVQGLAAIQRIFGHMLSSLDSPRFTIIDSVSAGNDAFLTWDFDFCTRGKVGRSLRIHGASHLRFGADGRVALHRDYWDAAEELYEKLPVLGRIMRWLKRRANS